MFGIELAGAVPQWPIDAFINTHVTFIQSHTVTSF